MNFEIKMYEFLKEQPQPYVANDDDFAVILEVSASTVRRWRQALIQSNHLTITCRWSNCKKRIEYTVK